MKTTFIETANGVFTAHFSPLGLAGLEFPNSRRKRPPSLLTAANSTPHLRDLHERTSAALQQALAGQSPDKPPPIDLSAGSAFQRRVWEVLRTIPRGKTLTYTEVAAAVGRPKAVRAVGGACGANPVPVLVPCHRVLAAHGGLGGFSGGLDWKRALLACEGVPPADNPRGRQESM